MSTDNRLRLIINFKNNELEKQLYDYVKNMELEGHSIFIKKLIYEDMKKKGLIK
jgi:hypothetical protein